MAESSIRLRLINGVSQDAAAAADDLRAVGDAADKAQDKIRGLGASGPALRGVGDATKDMGDRVGRGAMAVGRLGGALSLVAPQAGGLARAVADMGDVVEGAALAGSVLAVSMGAVVTTAGAAVVALGAYAAVAALAAAGTERMRARAAEYAETSAVLNDVIEAVDLAQQARDMAGLDDATRRVVASNREWAATLNDATRKLADQRVELQRRATDPASLGERLAGATALGGVESIVAGAARLAGFQPASQRQAEAVADLKTLDEAEAALNDEIERGRKLTDEAAEAERKRKEAEDRLRAAEAARNEVLRERTALLNQAAAITARAVTEEERLWGEIVRLAAEADRLGVPLAQVQPAIDALQKSIDDLDRTQAIKAAADAFDAEFAPAVDRSKAALDDVIAALNDPALTGKQKIAVAEASIATGESSGALSPTDSASGDAAVASAKLQNTAMGVGVASSVVSGGIGGGMSSLAMMGGPYGAMIAAAVGAIQAIGDGALVKLSDSIGDFGDTIGNLGGLLGDGINAIFTEGIPKMGEGMRNLADSLLNDLLPKLMNTLTDPDMWLGLFNLFWGFWVGFAEAIVEFVAKLLGEIVDVVGNLFDPDWWRKIAAEFVAAINPFDQREDGEPSRFLGINAEGTWNDIENAFEGGFASGTDTITRRGLALVHPGDRIVAPLGVPTGSARGAAASRTQQASSVTVNLHGFAVGSEDDLVRRLNRALGTANRRMKLAPGSV